MENIKLDKFKLLSFDRITSTQDYAHDLIAHGDINSKTIVTALSQSSGRGRYRRSWVSRRGNLYASFVYKTSERDPKISYAIAVAVAETLIHFGMNPQIKWPNDVLLDGKKISGILIEYYQKFVIIGIGINIKTCPRIDDYKTNRISKYNPNVDVVNVLNILVKKIDKWRNADFALVRERWMDLAVALNQMIKYHGKSVELIGINEDGALVLRDGTQYVLTYGEEISI